MKDIEKKVYNDISNKLLNFLKVNKIHYDLENERFTIQCKINSSMESKFPLDENYALIEKFSLRALAVLNTLDKLISPTPRKVFISSHLTQKIKTEISEDLVNQIDIFKKKFVEGEDVNSNLSKGIFDSNSWDYALNIWNIRHLHLSTSVSLDKNAMSSNRSDYLLFFAINNESVYFIDVRKHPKGSGFTSFDFLEIIGQNNWLDVMGFNELYGIEDTERLIEKNEDIYILAKVGVSALYKINGKIYICGLGISTLGNKGEHVLAVHNTIRTIKKWVNELDGKLVEYKGFDLLLNGNLGRINYQIGKDSTQSLPI